MNSSIPRMMLVASLVFAVMAGGVFLYWFFEQRPVQDCENGGNWWDPGERVCGRVVFIPDLTGRYHVDGRVDRNAVRLPNRPPPAQPLPER